jgi:membrane protease YdiL (CAAX protease family)
MRRRDEESPEGAGLYFAFALGWSFLFWIAAAWTGQHVRTLPTALLFYVGGAGPPLAAVGLTALRETHAGWRDFWLRVVDPRRIRGRWLAAALLVHPVLVGLALLVDVALGGSPSLAADGGRLVDPLRLIQLAFFVFWFGPLPEELGWRGYALDRLQGRMDALSGSLLLGSVWALWHVPLFFIEGTFQNEIGVGTPRFWLFLATLLPLSVLITWVYNHTKRSTLSAVLFHFSGNFMGAIVEKSDRVATLEFGLIAVAAIAVTWFSGRRRLVGTSAGSAV